MHVLSYASNTVLLYGHTNIMLHAPNTELYNLYSNFIFSFVAWSISIQQTFALVRVVRGD